MSGLAILRTPPPAVIIGGVAADEPERRISYDELVGTIFNIAPFANF
jgi:hypothetical protein